MLRRNISELPCGRLGIAVSRGGESGIAAAILAAGRTGPALEAPSKIAPGDFVEPTNTR